MAVRRISAALAALLAPLPLLAACGGGDSVADPPISSGPTSSPTTQRRESPEHFIRRWAAEEKRMENTGITRNYLAISRQCEPCGKLARQIRRYYAAGGYVRWGGWSIRSIKPYPGKPGALFEVTSVSKPTTYRESSSGSIQRLAGGRITYVLALSFDGTSWSLTNKSELQS